MTPDLARVGDLVLARGCRLGTPFQVAEETGSTNDDAKAGARAGAPHGAVWLAETQSHGRGRQGRSWVSPPGENLLFSVLLRLGCAPARVPPVSLAAGLAVRDALANVLSPRVLLKWPNDVVVSRPDGTFAKLAGILVESALSGSRVEHVVVGIGINVHTRTFPDAVAGLASSVALEGAAAPDRASILVDVLAGLDRDVENVAHRGLALVHGRIEAHDALLGREVESDDGALRGTAAGIDPEGRLIVRRDEGTLVRVSSGEVRVRLR